MRILALLFYIIFFPIKTFAISLDECQMEYAACKSAGGSECNMWEQIKSVCEGYGSSLISDSGGSGGVGQLPTIRDVDYFLSIELSTFLENFEIIISARKIVFFICGELSPKYIE